MPHIALPSYKFEACGAAAAGAAGARSSRLAGQRLCPAWGRGAVAPRHSAHGAIAARE